MTFEDLNQLNAVARQFANTNPGWTFAIGYLCIHLFAVISILRQNSEDVAQNPENYFERDNLERTLEFVDALWLGPFWRDFKKRMRQLSQQ